MYNLMTRNCHAFVADMLNGVRFQGKDSWNMVELVSFIIAYSQYGR